MTGSCARDEIRLNDSAPSVQGARFARVGGRCFFALIDEALMHVHKDAGNVRARRRDQTTFVYSMERTANFDEV